MLVSRATSSRADRLQAHNLCWPVSYGGPVPRHLLRPTCKSAAVLGLPLVVRSKLLAKPIFIWPVGYRNLKWLEFRRRDG